MGNSGSVSQMQSAGLKELHNYYQAQSNDNDTADDDFSFLRGEQKLSDRSSMPFHQTQFTRIPSSYRLNGLYSTSKTPSSGVNNNNNNSQHIKVLPRLSENLRLRSTTNGAILHSGGTISGRRESLLPQPLERSRTFITEHSDDECRKKNPSAQIMMMMQRRSQTQLDIDIRKRNPNGQMLHDKKRFSSNLDLRSMSVANANTETYSNENYQKLSKAKIRTKKRKAPQVPPTDQQIPIMIDQNNEFERRQRLFKTKTETSAINISKQQPIIKQSERRRQEPPSSPVIMRSKLNPGFRREKSFDAKFLSSETTRKNDRDLLKSSIDVVIKKKSPQIAKSTTISTPISVNEVEKADFKMELEAATKFRYRSMTTMKNIKPTTFQREPNVVKAKLLLPSRETQSKIPQLKKTFYFGMENSNSKPLMKVAAAAMTDLKQNIVSSLSALDETITTNSSFSKDHHEDYSLKHKCGDSKMSNDNGIPLNVRPTLPRRQLEIPRFSPVAAWRTLSASEEQHSKEQNTATISTSPSPSLNTAIEATNTFLIEDRIHRTYRNPCPFYPDNKSGDSGISADDGYIVEKPIQPRNLVQVQNSNNNCCHDLGDFDSNDPPVTDEVLAPPMKVVGPFLTAWTPQQDLDEEDTSSDGDNGGEITLNMPDNCQSPTSPHVFSLSLPRENQHAVYGEKKKPNFRSLQKLKRTTSGDLNDINCGCTNSLEPQHNMLAEEEEGGEGLCLNNFRSDNWVLSKTTGMTAASTSYLKNDLSYADRRIDGSNVIEGTSSFFDLSVSVQPMSLGNLATGKHVMYLPNRTTSGSEFKRQSIPSATAVAIRPPSENSLNKHDNSLGDSFSNSNIPTRNKRFSFQSSVRQIERRRIADKLSKEAAQKEALRKSELEAMRRVEEEFQKKRAYEKASIRHQLRLYSMDDDNFTSLPNNFNDYRADPDGAISSASESPRVFQRTTTGKRNSEYPNRGSDLEMMFSNS